MSTENTAPSSPFAAPAQTAPPAASPATEPIGDTSFLDGVSSREPLVKNTTVQGKVNALEIKESSAGKPFISIAVQLYGDKMVYEDGTPVSPGKRLTTTVFASGKTPEQVQRTGRTLKNLLLALHNVPLDGKEDGVYKAWPPQQKIGLISMPDGTQGFSLTPFAGDWADKPVMVEVRKGRDMDGNPRNEFVLLAAATKPVERKGR